MGINYEKLDDEAKYTLPYHYIRMADPFSIFAAHYRTYSEEVLNMLPPPPLEVLDAGCGDGYLSDILVKRGYSVTGVDVSHRAIIFARILVPDAAFEVCDLKYVGKLFRKCQFDVIVLNAVLEHIHPLNRKSVLRELHIILKAEGLLILSVPTPRLPQSPFHYNHFELEEIKELLRECGFVVQDVVYSHNMRNIAAKILFSRWMRLVENRFYDLKFVRRLLVEWFYRSGKYAQNPKSAGMLVVKAARA